MLLEKLEQQQQTNAFIAAAWLGGIRLIIILPE